MLDAADVGLLGRLDVDVVVLAACFLGTSVEEVMLLTVVSSVDMVEATVDVVAGVLVASNCPLAFWLTEGCAAA